MLEIVINESEYFDEEKQEFVYINEQTLRLEHSLVSLSKWESKWKKPYLNAKKTHEESIDYIRCMTITQNVNPLVYEYLPDRVMTQVQEYIDDPMTATTIRSQQKPAKKEIITAEIIYYWMISYEIPIAICEKWHLNRLLCLIKICEIKNNKQKKMPTNEVYSNNKALNAARRAKAKSKG